MGASSTATGLFENHRRLSFLQSLGFVAIVLAVMPGLPLISLMERVRFQDQLQWYRPVYWLAALGLTFVTGILVATTSAISLKRLGARRFEQACAATGLSGDKDAGFAGTWDGRPVRLRYRGPHNKRSAYIDLETQTACTFPLLFIGYEHAVATAMDRAAGYQPLEGLDPLYEGLRVVAPRYPSWARAALGRGVVMTGLRGLLDAKLALRSFVRWEDGQVTVGWVDPALPELSPERLVDVRRHLLATVAELEACAREVPFERGPAPVGAAPDAAAVRSALVAGVKQLALGSDGLVAMGALLLTLAAIFVAFLAERRYPMLDLWPALVWTVGVVCVLMGLAFATWRRMRRKPLWYSLVLGGFAVFGVPFVAFGAVGWMNGALGPSKGKAHTTEVTNKLRLSSGRAGYTTWLELRSWRAGRATERVRVSQGFFEARGIGDRIEITTRPGALGMEFWTSINGGE